MLLNLKFGDYVLLRRLAIGGQSEVFLAVKSGPRTFTRPVVIKALPAEARVDRRMVKLFYREAFISARFSHPNVINVHDARVIADDHCMLMDFVNGQTVADIAQRGYQQKCPPTLKQVVQIMADASAGLDYVHDFRDLDNKSYSVVHRDVSPQNLMVTYQGNAMLFDFGIARIIGFDDEDDEIDTLQGGKYAYMSPEQLEGKGVDPRSDIFSLGIILYELSTGYRLFRRSTPQEVIKAVTEEDIQSPAELKPEIPEFLDRVIMKALDRDPFGRYQTAGELRRDLLQFLETTTDGSNLRPGLGAYVAALFKEERSDVADTLRNAPELSEPEPLAGASLTDVGTDDFGETNRDPTMELAVPDEARAEISGAAREYEEQARAREGSERHVGELKDELHRIKRRQRYLYAALFVVFLIATLLAFVQLVDSTPTTAEEPPRELGDAR